MKNKTSGNFIIAIDGTSASGKGTLAKKIAQYLDFGYLDTGKLYRKLAAKLINAKLQNEKKIPYEIIQSLINQDHEEYLGSESIAKFASILATKKEIRSSLFSMQRNFAYSQKNGAVLDGRDIGSVICPEANLKIFITARPFIRAKRRFKELKSLGKSVSYRDVLLKLIYRDIRDSNRKESPLLRLYDALYIDSSNLSSDQIFIQVIKKIKTCLSR